MGEKLSYLLTLQSTAHHRLLPGERWRWDDSRLGARRWAMGMGAGGIQTSCSPAWLGLAVPCATFQHATWCSSLVPSMSGGQLLGVLVWAGHLSTAAAMGKVEGMGKELKAGTVSGCISLASPFSLKNGPSTVHLKPYLFIMRGAVCFFISLL